MRTNKLLATLALLLPVMAHAGGWYAGFDVGSARSEAKIDEHFFLNDTTARDSDNSTGWRVRGGYQFGRFFAIEAAYFDVGTVDYQFDPDDCPAGAPGPCPFNVRTSMNGYVGTLRGILPFAGHWFVDARVGFGKMYVDADQIGGSSLGASTSNNLFHYGIGGGYGFNKNWEIVLDFSGYTPEDYGSTLSSTSGEYNLSKTEVISVGVSYHW